MVNDVIEAENEIEERFQLCSLVKTTRLRSGSKTSARVAQWALNVNINTGDAMITFRADFTMNQRDRVFCLLDKNGDGMISVEELMEVMEQLGAPGEDARRCNFLTRTAISLSSDEFDTFQKQVEFMRKWEDRDNKYKTLIDEKLHDLPHQGTTGLIQLYNKELEDRLSDH